MMSVRIVAGIVASLVMATTVSAAVSKASIKCRATIAKKAAAAGLAPGLIKKGLATLDKCHAKRDKSGSPADCNGVDLSSLESKFATAINRVCKPDDPVRSNYRNQDPAAEVLGAVQDALGASGTAVQGAPDIAGDKTKAKCHAAIGKGRSAVVQAVTGAGVKCQTARDKHAPDLGKISADCIVTSGGAGSKASGKISGACGGIAGPDIGSCDPLPGCVIASAESTGTTLAKAIYGEPIICGDGSIEGDEQCDDGNTADGDSCTHDCKIAVCGDHVVSSGEECDDGNIDNTDTCTRVCAADNVTCVCRAARCGDGFVQADVEACDDGNDTPNDGCTNCRIDPTRCDPAVGVVATVAVSYDDISRSMHGFELNLGYPSVVAIPGSGQDTSVQDRLTDVAGNSSGGTGGVAFLLLGNDSDSNGDGTEDRLRIVYGALENVKKGDVVSVLLDCTTPNTFLQSASFTCAVTGTSDPDGQPIPGDNTCSVSVHVP